MQSDMNRKVVPDKGSLHRERPITKALKFPSRTRKNVFHLNWNGGCEKESIRRDTMTGVVAGSHQKTTKPKQHEKVQTNAYLF